MNGYGMGDIWFGLSAIHVRQTIMFMVSRKQESCLSVSPSTVVQYFSSGNTFFFAINTIEQADNHSMLPFVILPFVSS